MAILIFQLLFFTMRFTMPNGFRRTFRDVYHPYGPKMCANLVKDLTRAFVFETEDLTCRLDSIGDFVDKKLPSRSTCPNNEMERINYTSFDLSTGRKFCDSYLQDESLPSLSPHLNTETKPSRDVQSGKNNCNILLHQACEKGELCMVKYILSHGLADINCRDKLGTTPVMSASRQSQVDIFHFLVGQGCDLSTIDDNNNNILHVACIGGNTDIVRELVEDKKHDVESKGRQGRTPVLLSAYFGHKELLTFFAGADCNLTVVDNYRDNILHLACVSGKVDVVKYILSRRIIDIESRGKHGRTPVMTASLEGHVVVFKLLMSKGCDMRVVDDYNETVLHVACLGGKTEMVKYILSKQIVDIESRGKYGRTPVMTASREGHVAIVKLLMNKGCDMTVVDDYKDTVLHIACIGGKTEMVKYALSKQILYIDSRGEDGRTAVMAASQGGHVATVKLLMSKGCNMRAVDDYNDTVLHKACISGKTEMVKFILSKQILDVESRGKYGRTPVFTASRSGHVAIVKLLMSKGCNMKAVDVYKDNILHLTCMDGRVEMVMYILSKHIINIESRDGYGRTPLMLASWGGHVPIVKLLMSKGCNMRAVDDYKDTVLHTACMSGKVEMVKYILSKQIVDIESRGEYGRTPVMRASWEGRVAIVKLLMSKGCNMRLVDDYKDNILHLTCMGGRVEMVMYILSNKIIDIESRGNNGETSVMKAASKGHIVIVKLLMSKGCNMKAVDDYKDNILHEASIGGHIEMVKYILSMKIIDINSREENGRTPVMIAAEKGHIGIVKCLKSKGCNLVAMDNNRDNILHVACRYGQVDIVKYLIKLGVPERKYRSLAACLPKHIH